MNRVRQSGHDLADCGLDRIQASRHDANRQVAVGDHSDRGSGAVYNDERPDIAFEVILGLQVGLDVVRSVVVNRELAER